MRRFDAAPFAPQRLEKRRVLDAGAVDFLLGPVVGAGEYVQTSDVPISEVKPSSVNESGEETQGPLNVELFVGDTVLNENDILQLGVSFESPDEGTFHVVTIDWGDETPIETFTLQPGARFLGADHQYLDDGPTSEPVDINTIRVTVTDSFGTEAAATAEVTVNNVAPTIESLSITSPIEEGQVATLTGTFSDPGTQDTFLLDIDWDGDGEFDETIEVSGGEFEASQLFADDNPTRSLTNTFDVTVRLRDDDGGSDTDSVSLTVEDVSPFDVILTSVDPIDENGFVEIFVTFEDPGLEDTHFATITWGDGTLERIDIDPGERSFTATHQYIDDDPSGTSSDNFLIRVGVINDDLGRSVPRPTTLVLVNNVEPVLDVAADQQINVGELLNLTGGGLGAFTDVGTRDTHTATVDWGDGSAIETVDVNQGEGFGTLSGSHVFTETGTFTVTVTVLDDDLGETTETFEVEVISSELLLEVAENQFVAEGELLDLSEGGLGSFFYDSAEGATHTATVDYGDGSPVEAVEIQQLDGFGTLSGSHTYADNGSFTVTVTVFDEAGNPTTETFEVLVTNVDPVLQVAEDQFVDEGAVLDLTEGGLGLITDAGIEDTHIAIINWGDGSPEEFATVNQGSGSASLDATHIFADDGVYIVTVTVIDDDLGETTETFEVLVSNVDPELAGIDPILQVNEGESFTLADLGVTLTDPGFDNPLNPNFDPGDDGQFDGEQGGSFVGEGEFEFFGSVETFFVSTVNWGDGTEIESLGVSNLVSGAPGVATTADLVSSVHTYADNGLYTVTVVVGDDDGGLVTRTFQIQVNNVAPSLELTSRELVISESEFLDLFDLGTFSDPGFNNPLNLLDPSNGGEVTETFSYTIDWGDGTVETGVLPASVINGSAGVETIGELVDQHQYLDNDADNVYTITVTLSDDDGGTVTQTITTRVLNINPTLIPIISATDVNTSGQTTIVIQFEDPGTETLTVFVDWGDQLDLPPAERFVPEIAVLGPGTNRLSLEHTYDGPPDPNSPSADIEISVFVQDDDFGFPGVVAAGISETQAVIISNPGIGAQPIASDTTPEVPRLVFPQQQDAIIFVASNSVAQGNIQTVDLRTVVGDTKSTTDRFLELRVIDPATGEQSEGFRLRTEVLDDLPSLFRTLPDNRYRIYLVRTETNTRRLVIEVYVRNGKLIDPGDDSEGTRDRPPTDESSRGDDPPADKDAEQTDQPSSEAVDQLDAPILQPAQAPSQVDTEQGEAIEAPADEPLPVGAVRRRMLLGTSLLGLAASQAGKSWSERVEKALSEANEQKWQKLRRKVKTRKAK